MEKENRRIWRPLPCEDYDIESLEAWLTDMGNRGWYLTKDGLFLGFACFEERPVGPIQYRLEGALHNPSMWSDKGENPDEEALELSQEFGWDYVARIGQFFIYASTNPEPREFNTDPQVQSIALNAVKRRMLDDAIYTILWLGVYVLLSIKGMVLQLMLELGTIFVSLGIFLVLHNIVRGILRVVHMHKLKKKLLQEGYLTGNPQWKKRLPGFYIKEALLVVLTVAWLIWGVSIWAVNVGEENRHSIKEEPVDPPFATLTDMVPGAYDTMFRGMGDSYQVWSDILAPVAWDWEEIAEIQTQTGETFSGNLYVTYYETRWEFLAKILSRGYLWQEQFEKGYEVLTPPELDVDYAAMFTTHYMGGNCLILQQNNRVIRVRLYTGDDLPLEVWSRQMAESIKDDA